MFQTDKKAPSGYALIEVLVAIAIFAIITSGMVAVVLRSLSANLMSSEETIATQYAVEGLEAVRSIANQASSITYTFAGVTNPAGANSNKVTTGANQKPTSPGTELSTTNYTSIGSLDTNRFAYSGGANIPEEMYRFYVNNPTNLSTITNLSFTDVGYERKGDEIETISENNASSAGTITVPPRDGISGGTLSVNTGTCIQSYTATIQSEIQAIPSVGNNNASVSCVSTSFPMDTPYYLAMSSDNSTIYTANYGNNTVTKVSNLNGTPTYDVLTSPTFNQPTTTFLTSDNSTLYVTNYGNNTITKVSNLNSTPTYTTLSGGNMSGPWDLVLSPDNTTAYIANYLNKSVTVISNLNGTPTYTNLTGGGLNEPSYINITPDGSAVYTTNFGNNTLTKITNLIGTPVLTQLNSTLISEPWDIIFTPDGSTAYVASSGNNTVVKVTNLNSSPTYTTLSGGSMKTPTYVVLTSDGSTLYVNNQNNNSVTKIANLNGTPTYSNMTGGSMDEPDYFVLTSDNSTLYVANAAGASITKISGLPSTPTYSNLTYTQKITTYTVDFNGALAGASISPMTTSSPSWSISRLTPTDYRQAYIWNFQTSSWQSLGSPDTATGADDPYTNTVTVTTSNYTNYFNSSNYVYFRVVGQASGATMYTNYAALSLFYKGLTGSPLTQETTGLTTTSGVWALKGPGTHDQYPAVNPIYTRTITIAPVERDNNGNIVSSGGTNDPNTQQVTANVTWMFNGVHSESVNLSTYLTDWTDPN